MATEEQIQKLAYNLWDQAGRPEGRDQEHYYAAKKTLEGRKPVGAAGVARPTSTPLDAARPESMTASRVPWAPPATPASAYKPTPPAADKDPDPTPPVTPTSQSRGTSRSKRP